MSSSGEDLDWRQNARKELEDNLKKVDSEIAWSKVTLTSNEEFSDALEITSTIDVVLDEDYTSEDLDRFMKALDVRYELCSGSLAGIVMFKDGSWLRRDCQPNSMSEFDYWDHIVPPKFED